MRHRLSGLLIIGLVGSPLVVLAEEIPETEAGGEPVTPAIIIELEEVADRLEPVVAPEQTERVTERGPRWYRAHGEERLGQDARRFRVVTTTAEERAGLVERLRADRRVRQVWEEQEYTTAVVPSDTRFAEQYGLFSAAQPLADINAPAAWEKTTGAAATVVAIIDGGIDLTHADLLDKRWTNPDEVPGNKQDDDGNGFVDDVAGWDFVGNKPAQVAIAHATHVAGIAGAASNNGVGVSGVDWGTRLMSVRVLNSAGVGRESWIARGIDYAVENGADVINLSLVGGPSPLIGAAIENAYAAGVVVVAAAGNFGLDTTFRSLYPVCADIGGVDMVLGVAATDQKGEPASFSNYGRCVNVAAPGKTILSTVPKNRYKTMSGTSMSAPFVTGVAGLYLALHPGASPAEVIAAITSNADPFTGSKAATWNQKYKGKLNAARVVGAAESVPAVSPSPTVSPTASPTLSPAPSPTVEAASTPQSGSGDGGGGGSEDPTPPEASRGKSVRVAGVKIVAKANLALLGRIKDTFRFAFGRVPTLKEKNWWADRVKLGQKRTYLDLLGAMHWQKTRGRTMGK